MTDPFFSIITVTRDNLTRLQKTYQSLQLQSCNDFEWIVQDGASNDGTIGFLKITGALCESVPDLGIYDAMNKALKRAQGKYVLFLNAGDTLASKNVLERIKIEAEGFEFIYGDSIESGHVKKARPHTKISQGMITHHQAMMYRKDKIGFYNLSYSIAADYDLTLRVLKGTNKILYLDFPVCVFEPGGVSQTQALQGRIEQFKIRRAYGLSALKAAVIFAAQSGLYALRRLIPPLYWKLKALR